VVGRIGANIRISRGLYKIIAQIFGKGNHI